MRYRERTGDGRLIEIARIEVGAAITAEPVIQFSMTGEIALREGNRHRTYAQGVYPAAGDDDWVALTVRNESDWAAMVEAMGAEAVRDDARFVTAAARQRNHDAFDALVTAWTSTLSADEAAAVLNARGVPAERVLTADRMYGIPQLDSRGFYQEIEHPITGSLRYPGWPMRFSPGPVRHHRMPPPTLGQHNDEILSYIGLSREEVAALEVAQVIGRRVLNL